VKEKETAHREYKKAISEGHGAYLMDEESPVFFFSFHFLLKLISNYLFIYLFKKDVFTVSVGNLPPKTTAIIKITYITELSVEGDEIIFTLPNSIAPTKKSQATKVISFQPFFFVLFLVLFQKFNNFLFLLDCNSN